MPLYEYECRDCKRRVEKIQKFSDAPLTVCAHCGGALERTVTAAAVSFKGGGWYKDLYSSAKPAGGGAKAEGGGDGGSGESGGPGSSKGEGASGGGSGDGGSGSGSGAGGSGSGASAAAPAAASAGTGTKSGT